MLLLTIGCIASSWRGRRTGVPRPAGLRGRIRARGWGLLLLPVAMAAAVMAGGAHGLIPAELGIAVLAIVFAPKLAAKLVPYGVLGLAVFGVMLARMYHDGFTNQVQYLFVHAGPGSGAPSWCWPRPGSCSWSACGCCCGWTRRARGRSGRWPPGGWTGGRGGISAAHGLLLIPVVGLAMQLLGPGNWFGCQAVDGLDAALIDLTVATAALVLIFRSRAWAATLAAAGLLVLGVYGWLIAVFWPAVPGFAYGFTDLHNSPVPAPLWVVALQGSLLLAAGPVAGAAGDARAPGRPPDLELADRAQQLTQRVQTLTKTRSDAVDTAVAELRRIERDLHDGAQARLVAVGMSLRAAEQLIAD